MSAANQRFEVVIRSESKLASWESAAEGLERERGTRELSSGGKRGKKEGGRSRPQSGSVYKVKEETNGAGAVGLRWSPS